MAAVAGRNNNLFPTFVHYLFIIEPTIMCLDGIYNHNVIKSRAEEATNGVYGDVLSKDWSLVNSKQIHIKQLYTMKAQANQQPIMMTIEAHKSITFDSGKLHFCGLFSNYNKRTHFLFS